MLTSPLSVNLTILIAEKNIRPHKRQGKPSCKKVTKHSTIFQ